MFLYEFDAIGEVIDKAERMFSLLSEMECREMTEEEWLQQFYDVATLYVENEYALLGLEIYVEGDLEPFFTDAIERFEEGERWLFDLFVAMRDYKEAIVRTLLPYVYH